MKASLDWSSTSMLSFKFFSFFSNTSFSLSRHFICTGTQKVEIQNTSTIDKYGAWSSIFMACKKIKGSKAHWHLISESNNIMLYKQGSGVCRTQSTRDRGGHDWANTIMGNRARFTIIAKGSEYTTTASTWHKRGNSNFTWKKTLAP
jgi:hypothetical protein